MIMPDGNTKTTSDHEWPRNHEVRDVLDAHDTWLNVYIFGRLLLFALSSFVSAGFRLTHSRIA